ncbi:uncharacterized protein LTR77_010346 [Saxophila tyrrhenica]|uniref:DNA-binding protein RAP1 n=1 Tax=Saxophila tyrrhenica TaxID=1690608 RepID=A0AAV9NW43_9PEZI|nr:hypothetical protein LTR77_010346 [Saxophila tyrrhenica]
MIGQARVAYFGRDLNLEFTPPFEIVLRQFTPHPPTMASARVVVNSATDATLALGGLFKGLAFFVLRKVPQRTQFVQKIQANGGRVVQIEAQADHVIADHYRQDCPPGSISYQFVDKALKDGELPDPAAHPAGAPVGTVRPAGSGLTRKGTRTEFSAEDDRVLWQWVEDCRAQGGKVKGNEIYKQLEAVNPRHTFQAWRDRYIKRLMDNAPAGANLTVPANPPPSPPDAPDQQDEVEARRSTDLQPTEVPEGNADPEELMLDMGSDIERIAEDQQEEAWSTWAQTNPQYSAEEWRRIWHEKLRPIYLQRQREAGLELQPEDESDSSSSESEDKVVAVEEVRAESRQKRKGPPASIHVAPKKQRISPQPDEGREQNMPQQGADLGTAAPAEVGEIIDMEDIAENQAVKDGSHSAILRGDEEALLTSDLNRGVQAQLIEEALDRADPPPAIYSRPQSRLPTSDFNREAEQQLRRESGEQEDEDVAAANEDEAPANLEAEGILHTPDDTDARTNAAVEPSALTEANLASQQAEHRAKVPRASDLPPDEDDVQVDEAQENFANYLRDLLSPRAKAPANDAAELPQQQQTMPVGGEVDRPAKRRRFASELGEEDNVGELPLSSDAQIEDAMNDMIRWPESPERSQRNGTIQADASQFETQVVYPSLEPRDTRTWTSSSPRRTNEPIYPQLPTFHAHLNADEQKDGEDIPTSSPPGAGRLADRDTYHLMDGKPCMRPSPQADEYDMEDEDDEQLDLSLPMPEGGWDSSSPPAQSQPAQRAQATQERESSEPTHPRQRHPAKYISSDSSSSDPDDLADFQPRVSGQRHHALETQDILNAETQMPDLTFPLPPDSDPSSDPSSENLPSDPLNPPSSPPTATNPASQSILPTTTQKPEDDDTETFIAKMVVHGYAEAAVIAALMCTSMRTEFAELVLLEQRAGKGFPRDVPGIWSGDDDAMIESGNGNWIRDMAEKHGMGEVDARLEFLAGWRDLEAENEEG